MSEVALYGARAPSDYSLVLLPSHPSFHDMSPPPPRPGIASQSSTTGKQSSAAVHSQRMTPTWTSQAVHSLVLSLFFLSLARALTLALSLLSLSVKHARVR